MTLKQIKQAVYKYSEKTPPEVKYSENNYLVAKIVQDIDLLVEYRKEKRKTKKP